MNHDDDITTDEILKSLGDSAAFGSLKKLLKDTEKSEITNEAVPEAKSKREQRAHNLGEAQKSIKHFDVQIKQNQRSIHLDFIQEETANRGTTALTSTKGLISSTDTVTDFEKEFRQAVEDSGMNWSENHVNQLPASAPIELDRERRQMARIRTLLRAEQIRARRLKKIKSKTYRRLLRKKEMKGMAELISKLDKDDPEAAEQVRAELERKLSTVRLNRQRQARMKWSQAAQRFGGSEIRNEISKQAQAEADEKRELLRAIKGKTEDQSDDSDDSSSDDSSGDESDIVARVKRSITDKVVAAQTPTADKEGGLFGLQFMRDAAKRQESHTISEAQKFVDTLEGEESNDESGSSDSGNHADTQENLVASLFSDPVEETKPAKKSSAFKLDKPENSADAIPGWGSWIGEGVKQRAPKRLKTIETESKPSPQSAIVHMIPEETLREPLMKYQVKEVPYPFNSREEFEAATGHAIGPEWTSLSAHRDAIKPRVSARLGAVIPPIKLAKRLDSDKRARIIDAWDNRKKVNPTKARFL